MPQFRLGATNNPLVGLMNLLNSQANREFTGTLSSFKGLGQGIAGGAQGIAGPMRQNEMSLFQALQNQKLQGQAQTAVLAKSSPQVAHGASRLGVAPPEHTGSKSTHHTS